MNDLPKRVLTAIFLGIGVIGGIYYSVYTFIALMIVIGAFASFEYIKLASFGADISIPHSMTKIGALLSAMPLLFYGLIKNTEHGFELSLLLGSILIMGLLAYFLIKNEVNDYKMYQAISMSIMYITIPFLLMIWVSIQNGHYQWLKPMTLLALIWCNDVMAYFVGRLFGKRPLYSKISPKKTIEGFVGGLVLSVAGALILSIYVQHLTPTQWVIYGFVVSICSTVGDLFESMIKRRYGVKDSGTALPGHGGFLDRFDAFIFVIPIATLFLYLWWK
ncbi:MAG: phosphatidate cytidylyltransferase [Saprospiraceae bacterium]|nr:phosphatidate cytidylyltransferase [Saprospiraceae bacterium]